MLWHHSPWVCIRPLTAAELELVTGEMLDRVSTSKVYSQLASNWTCGTLAVSVEFGHTGETTSSIQTSLWAAVIAGSCCFLLCLVFMWITGLNIHHLSTRTSWYDLLIIINYNCFPFFWHFLWTFLLNMLMKMMMMMKKKMMMMMKTSVVVGLFHLVIM